MRGIIQTKIARCGEFTERKEVTKRGEMDWLKALLRLLVDHFSFLLFLFSYSSPPMLFVWFPLHPLVSAHVTCPSIPPCHFVSLRHCSSRKVRASIFILLEWRGGWRETMNARTISMVSKFREKSVRIKWWWFEWTNYVMTLRCRFDEGEEKGFNRIEIEICFAIAKLFMNFIHYGSRSNRFFTPDLLSFAAAIFVYSRALLPAFFVPELRARSDSRRA